MPAPVKQTIQLDIQAPQESKSLAGQLAQLKQIQSVINEIQAVGAKGLNFGAEYTRSLNQVKADLAKGLPATKTPGFSQVFGALGFKPEQLNSLKAAALEAKNLSTSFNKAEMSWRSFTAAQTDAYKIIGIARANASKLLQTSIAAPAGSAGGKAVFDAGLIKTSIEGKVQLVIPASQIQTVIEGRVSGQWSGVSSGGGGGRGAGKARMGTYSWGGEGATSYDRPSVQDLRMKALGGGVADFSSSMGAWASQYAKDAKLAAQSASHSFSFGGDTSLAYNRPKVPDLRMKALGGGISDFSGMMESWGAQTRRDAELKSQAIQASVNTNYEKRIALIKQEEQEILHRNQLEGERMKIIAGPDYHLARARQLGTLSGEYGRLARMPGQNPEMRREFQRRAELLSAQALNATNAAHNETNRGGRWLSGGVKGLTVPGFAKNILTVTGWTAAVTAMYAPIQLAEYSFKKMIDVGLQTQRLSQVFRGVGGNAQELTQDVMRLAVATGQSTEAAMNSAISWSRFGLNRKEVVEATRVTLMAANTANISPELAGERMGAIYSDYGLGVNQLSGALGILERTANTTKVQVKDLMDAVMISGSVARQTGMSFAEFQAIIGTTAQRTSQTGNRIATAYKSVIGSLLNPQKQEQLRMNFGINVLDEKGQMKSSEDIFRDMFVSYQKMSSTQREQFSYVVGDKQQANRFIAMMNSYVQAQAVAVDGQLNLNTAQEANIKIMASQTAQLAALRAEWDRFVVNTSNRPGGGGVLIPGIGGGIIGALNGLLRNPTNPIAALIGGAKGFGIGAGLGGISSLSGASSINESLVDTEKFAKNILAIATNPAVSGLVGGAFSGRIAGRMAGSALTGTTAARIGAGFAGMSEAELAATGARFGPWGAVIGAGIGLATGMQPQGPRKNFLYERMARGEGNNLGYLGTTAAVITNTILHPIRTFNAVADIIADDPFGRFADERANKVDEFKQYSQAYARAAKTIGAVGSILGMNNVSGEDKASDLKSISGMLGGSAAGITAMFNQGDTAGAAAELQRLARENIQKSLSENKSAEATAAGGISQGEAENARDRDKITALQSMKAGDFKGIGFGGMAYSVTDKDAAANQVEIAKLTDAIRDREAQITAEKEKQSRLLEQDAELEHEKEGGLDEKMHTMIAIAEKSSEAAKALSEMTISGTPLEALDKQTELLKQQAGLYNQLGTQFYAMAQPNLGQEYQKKGFDLLGMSEANQRPEYRQFIQQQAELQLRNQRVTAESQNAAVGFTEAEKQIARARFDAEQGKSAALSGNDSRAQAMEKDYHETRIALVTRYNSLLSEQKQLQMDIAREYGKSLLFGDPGDLLTKLSAARMMQRDGGRVGAGDWFATSGGVRSELDTLSGGEQGRTNRRERGTIQRFFGGRIPTVDEEVAGQNKIYFKPPITAQAGDDNRNARQKEMDSYYEKAGYGKYHWSHPEWKGVAHFKSADADASAKSALEIASLGKTANDATTGLSAFVAQLASTVTQLKALLTPPAARGANNLTLPGTTGAGSGF